MVNDNILAVHYVKMSESKQIDNQQQREQAQPEAEVDGNQPAQEVQLVNEEQEYADEGELYEQTRLWAMLIDASPGEFWHEITPQKQTEALRHMMDIEAAVNQPEDQIPVGDELVVNTEQPDNSEALLADLEESAERVYNKMNEENWAEMSAAKQRWIHEIFFELYGTLFPHQ